MSGRPRPDGPGTPPHVRAAFDQAQAQQNQDDQPPPGVVVQVLPDDVAAVRALLSIEGVVQQYRETLVKRLSADMRSGDPGRIDQAAHAIALILADRFGGVDNHVRDTTR